MAGQQRGSTVAVPVGQGWVRQQRHWASRVPLCLAAPAGGSTRCLGWSRSRRRRSTAQPVRRGVRGCPGDKTPARATTPGHKSPAAHSILNINKHKCGAIGCAHWAPQLGLHSTDGGRHQAPAPLAAHKPACVGGEGMVGGRGLPAAQGGCIAGAQLPSCATAALPLWRQAAVGAAQHGCGACRPLSPARRHTPYDGRSVVGSIEVGGPGGVRAGHAEPADDGHHVGPRRLLKRIHPGPAPGGSGGSVPGRRSAWWR